MLSSTNSEKTSAVNLDTHSEVFLQLEERESTRKNSVKVEGVDMHP